MASFGEFAVRIRELIPLIESGTFVEGTLLVRLNQAVSGGAELVRNQGSDTAENVGDYCRALEELSSCLRRCESRLLDRKMHVANELRHLRNADQWARSSADTL
jgi:hypothetical protein